MAQQPIQLQQEKLSCSICLDLLNDPVTIPCGHNYCMSCINVYWDKDEKKTFHCPQCRQDFTPRPALVKNTMLAEIVEDLKKKDLKKVGLAAALPDDSYSGPGDVACDFCTGRKLKAVKSCLVCLASYCEQHLQPHYDVGPLKKHKLVEATLKLQENICPHHDEVMKIYCRTDKKCICYLCSIDQHKGHDTVSAGAERAKRLTDLAGNQNNIRQTIQNREEDVKTLQNQIEAVNLCAEKTVMDSENVFKDLISLIEKKSSNMTQKIITQQQTEVGQMKELQEKMRQEIEELKRQDSEIERLSVIEDNLQFINSHQSLSLQTAATSLPSKSLKSHIIEEVMQAVLTLRDGLLDTLGEEAVMSGHRVSKVTVPEPTTRYGFLKYAWQISLDPLTANPFLSLSPKKRKATLMQNERSVDSNPERFVKWWQVLGSDGLTGRCYWEVKWNGRVSIAVTYKDIGREGNRSECALGHYEDSWALRCVSSGYSFWHDNSVTQLSGPQSSRVGVYLDHSAGLLSFYSITETMTLLHRVQTRFTQPLYPGFWLLDDEDSVELKFSP